MFLAYLKVFSYISGPKYYLSFKIIFVILFEALYRLYIIDSKILNFK